ncbi:MAG: C-terminal binding protein, partial [Lachnospiraceae bacterium]|nr:C-terminal binding protein [Lachnospiraceae bacterium]
MPDCKGLVRHGIGYDPSDVAEATKRGIAECNIPDYCIEEVATHTIALMLALIRKLHIYHAKVRDGIWVSNSDEYPFYRVSTLTLGLIGFGNIARKMAEYAKAFGMRLIAYDPYLKEDVFTDMGVEKAELDDLYAQADVVSLHLPLFENTRHILNAESFAKMKDGVFVINTARGALIDLDALLAAIDSGKVAAAGMDVIECEPIREKNHRIFESGRVIQTSHVAYNSTEASKSQLTKAAQSAVRVLKGELPPNVVNRKELLNA